MSLALNKAIVARIRGTESLTGDALTAQTALGSLLGSTSAGTPAVRYGAKAQSPAYPEVTFREDAGTQALAGEQVGIVSNCIYRFEIWDNTRSGSIIPQVADYLEKLFDERRGAPAFTLDGDGRVYGSDLFSPLQGPLPDENHDAFFGLIAFRFVEARP